jgi:hypothetical protein
LPFIYLGVPIFKGKPKTAYFQPLVDKIKIKLASWKASLLSYAGRCQLIKSVVQSMMIYSITIYSWPISLIKELEKYLRNFLWSGNLNIRKFVTVSLKTVCSPLDEGGLGIKSLSSLNQASNLKLFWDLMNTDNHWATFLRSRVVRTHGFINYHIHSSIWSGLKSIAYLFMENTRWQLGDGNKINFWIHDWCGSPFSSLFNIPPHVQLNLHSTVSEYIVNQQWNIPLFVQHTFHNIMSHINKVTIPLEQSHDQILWKHSTCGELSLKDVYQFISPSSQKLDWAKLIWNIAIPPSKSFMMWRLIHNRISTCENLSIRGFLLPSMCSLCCKHSETSSHLFMQCPFVVSVWN